MAYNEFKLEKYVDMKDFEGSWIFYIDDVRVQDEELEEIKPLTDNYSSFLWKKYISEKSVHIMLMKEDEYLLKPKSIYNFNKDWNSRKYQDLAAALYEALDFDCKDTIYFFWNCNWGVEISWEFFLKHWINFLFEDEGPIIINPCSYNCVLFSPQGEVIIAKRRV